MFDFQILYSLVSIDFFHKIFIDFPNREKHSMPIEVMCSFSKEVV